MQAGNSKHPVLQTLVVPASDNGHQPAVQENIAHDSAGMVTVLLVGRTGLDAALRLDPHFEIHRAENGVAAIGQLSLLEARHSSEPVVVVLGPGSDPTRFQKEFTDAVSQVRADARTACLTTASTAARSGEHASINATDPPAAIRAKIRSIAYAERSPVVLVPPIPNHTVPSSPASNLTTLIQPAVCDTAPAGNIPPAPADMPLLQAMLTGRDLLLPALDIMRRTLGTVDVRFEKAGTNLASEAAPSLTGTVVEVRHGAQVFGRLVSPTLSEAALQPWSVWFAHWLALRDQHEQLKTGALTDDLTGAWNRRYFDRFLEAAVRHAAERSHIVTVLYFDIDNFKSYNDRYGHAAGDEILRETVRLLLSVIRPTDRVCRIGGDEFGVIFHEPDGPRDPASKPPASIWSIAQRFQRQISEHRFPKLLSQAPGTLTISGGLASYPIDAKTPAELVCKADELAMQSKRQGKNAITLGPGAERECRGGA